MALTEREKRLQEIRKKFDIKAPISTKSVEESPNTAVIDMLRNGTYGGDQMESSTNITEIEKPQSRTLQSPSQKMIQNVTQQRQPNQSFAGKTADVINRGVEAVARGVEKTGASKLFGGLIGATGGVLGGAVGAIGTPIANLIKGRPLTENLSKNIKETAKSTAEFGYNIGKAGTEAAPLGAAGRAASIAIAYGQGYQGIEDLKQGLKTGDTEQIFTGAVELGTSLLGAKGAVKSKGILINPEAVEAIRTLPQNTRASVANAFSNSIKKDYIKMVNITSKEVQKAPKWLNEVPDTLVKEGIIPSSQEGMLKTVDNQKTLSERIAPYEEELQSQLGQVKGEIFDLNKFREETVKSIDSQKNVASLERNKAKAYISDLIDAEIADNGGNPMMDASRVNNVKRAMWNLSYTTELPKIANEEAYTLGKMIKESIETEAKKQGIENIKSTNQEIGRLADAIQFLKRIDGRKIKGGFMGKLFDKGIGATIGTIWGGPVGTLVGAEIAGKVGETIRNPAIKIGAKMKAMESVKKSKGMGLSMEDVSKTFKAAKNALQQRIDVELPKVQALVNTGAASMDGYALVKTVSEKYKSGKVVTVEDINKVNRLLNSLRESFKAYDKYGVNKSIPLNGRRAYVNGKTILKPLK